MSKLQRLSVTILRWQGGYHASDVADADDQPTQFLTFLWGKLEVLLLLQQHCIEFVPCYLAKHSYQAPSFPSILGLGWSSQREDVLLELLVLIHGYKCPEAASHLTWLGAALEKTLSQAQDKQQRAVLHEQNPEIRHTISEKTASERRFIYSQQAVGLVWWNNQSIVVSSKTNLDYTVHSGLNLMVFGTVAHLSKKDKCSSSRHEKTKTIEASPPC